MRIETHMRSVLPPLVLAGALAVGLCGCVPEPDSAGPEEPLVTEDIGGAIDAELSTEDDPKGRRRVDSGQVLPPGFPVDLPVPAGASVVESDARPDGPSRVVFEIPTAAPRLAESWAQLLEAEGWHVVRSGDFSLDATRAERTVSTTVFAAGTGSRLRIDY